MTASSEAWPNPTSAYELRLHLAHDHGGDMRAAGWHEMDQTHRHLHRVGANHEHEKAGVA